MATIKEAVRNASAFAEETLGTERTADLRLEEVESGNVNGQDAWRITLSMIAPPSGSPSSASVFTALNALTEPKRDYKVFTVLKNTGEVASMKIRELATT